MSEITWNTHIVDDSMSVQTGQFIGTERWVYAFLLDGLRHENFDDVYASELQALEAGRNDAQAQRRIGPTRG